MSTLSSLFEKFAALLCPTGAVIFVMRKDCPEGFLIINGQKVYQTDYPRLYTYLLNLGTLQSGTDETGAYVTLPPADGRFFEATTKPSKVGTLVEAGLPNITGAFSNSYRGIVGSTEGAFTNESWNRFRDWGASGDVDNYDGAAFDASRSNQLFGQSQSVQPSSMMALPCIKI